MISINYMVVGTVIGLLSYPYDKELDERLNNLDGDDEREVKAVFRDVLVPYILSFDSGSQYLFKETLRYMLTATDAPLEGVFDMLQLSFELPSGDPRLFYQWLWEETYLEDFSPANLEKYHVTGDMSIVHEMKVIERN